MFLLSIFLDFFNWNNDFLYNNTNNRHQLTDKSFLIIYSTFFNISSSSEGGCIYCFKNNCYLVLEYSNFHQCTSNGDGGCIYFISNNGGIIFNYICSFKCQTNTISYG